MNGTDEPHSVKWLLMAGGLRHVALEHSGFKGKVLRLVIALTVNGNKNFGLDMLEDK